MAVSLCDVRENLALYSSCRLLPKSASVEPAQDTQRNVNQKNNEIAFPLNSCIKRPRNTENKKLKPII